MLEIISSHVNLNDPVCVDCRWYANEKFKELNPVIENTAEVHV